MFVIYRDTFISYHDEHIFGVFSTLREAYDAMLQLIQNKVSLHNVYIYEFQLDKLHLEHNDCIDFEAAKVKLEL